MTDGASVAIPINKGPRQNCIIFLLTLEKESR